MNQKEIKRRQIGLLADGMGFVILFLLVKIVGFESVVYIAAAYETMQLIWTVTGKSSTDALGRILRSRRAKGQYKNAAIIGKNIIFLQGVTGLLGSILFVVVGGFFAGKVFGIPHAAAAFWILAPALFLRNLSAALEGSFVGEGIQLASVIAGIMRRVFQGGFCVLFCSALYRYGEKAGALLILEEVRYQYAGIGFAIAITLTELLVLLFMILLYFGNRQSRKKESVEGGMRATENMTSSIGIYYSHAGLQSLTLFLERLPIWLGMVLYLRYLQTHSSVSYGVFYGGFLIAAGLPAVLVCVLMIPVCVRTSAGIRREEMRYARNGVQTGFQSGIVYALFMTVFLAVTAAQSAELLGGTEHARILTQCMQYGSAVVLFRVLIFYFSGVLSATGKRLLVMIGYVTGNIAYLIALIPMLNGGKLGILSLVDALVVGAGICCVVLGAFVFMQIGSGVDWLHCVLLPAIAAAVVGLADLFLGKALAPHLGVVVTLLICFVAAFLIFWILLLFTGCFREQDLKSVPCGSLIRKLGQLLRIY